MLIMTCVYPLVTTGSIYNVQDYGAVGDGVTLETKAIQAAVDECSKKGGTVLLTPGTYLSGTIYMRSNVTLHISQGATLLGSADLSHYPANAPDIEFYGSTWLDYALIYGEDLENIALEGKGRIDGQGAKFVIENNKKPFRYMNRPYIIWFIKSKNIRVEDLYLTNSALWMQHYLACENIRITGIEVYNHANKNNDMIDIDGCKDVIISDCIGDTDDDALTFKSTCGIPVENVTVTNSIFSSHCNAIKFGTESTGGFKNITISNCVVKPSESSTKIYGSFEGDGGLALEMVDGGVMEGIIISNIRIHGSQVPLFIRLGNRTRPYKDGQTNIPVGKLRNVHISNIIATGANQIGSSITGIPGFPVQDISLSNISIHYSGGGTKEDAERLIPEEESSYPEGNMFGNLSAYGLFIRHAENINMENIKINYNNDDVRPALVIDDGVNIRITSLQAKISSAAPALIRINNSRAVFITTSSARGKVNVFALVEGQKTADIYLVNNWLESARKSVRYGAGVDKKTVTVK
ncbi:MAG: glycoside hydrolase [Candidatus Marinimicrobia bacterium]|nr:glycoside hydrolase [Candidatus Neomarinimicrobiota bacterium]